MTDPNSYPPQLSTATFKPFKIRLSQSFGRYTLEKSHFTLEPFMEHVAHEMMLKVELYVLGQENIQTYEVVFDVPNTWRDQFLYEMRWVWLSRQLQRIRPIKWRAVKREITFSHWALLPKFDKAPPGMEYTMFTQPPTEPGVTKK